VSTGIPRAIAWVERQLAEDREALANLPPDWQAVNVEWGHSLTDVLAVLRAAEGHPDGEARVRAVAAMQVAGGSRDAQFLWSKVMGWIGSETDSAPPG
jgi:hypothetical protein